MQTPPPRKSNARSALAFGSAGLFSEQGWLFLLRCSILSRFFAAVLRYRATDRRPVRPCSRAMYRSNKQRPKTRYTYNAA
jgi:hypothetical protein